MTHSASDSTGVGGGHSVGHGGGGHSLPSAGSVWSHGLAHDHKAGWAYWIHSRNPYLWSGRFGGRRRAARIGRNDPCPCGSGEKFKNCCIGKSAPVVTRTWLIVGVVAVALVVVLYTLSLR